jgi:site-specific DNA-methyltransferase (adenine-specific)
VDKRVKLSADSGGQPETGKRRRSRLFSNAIVPLSKVEARVLGGGGLVPATPSEPAAVWVLIEELRPWIGNPRKNQEAVQAVADSIRKFGFGAPVIARLADKQIIAGHTRLLAARRLGLTHVPVRYLDLSAEDAQVLALADNRLGEIAEWDEGMLGRVLEELKAGGADLSATGFGTDEIDRLLADLAAENLADVEEDPVPEPPDTPTSVPGTVYELGSHRLLCGDSTHAAEVQRVVAKDRVSLLWTDPPYNVSYQGAAGSILNDHMSRERFRAFLVDAFRSCDAVMQPGTAFYLAHADTEGLAFRQAVETVGWKLSSCLIWCKDSLVLGRGDYHWQHEPILYGWKPGSSHHAVADRTQTTVWEIDRPKRNDEHPTMKPVPLIERAIRNSTDSGEVVLDVFGGSGSTLIAAARTGRRAMLVELDPKFCDVIRARWERFQAKVARRG